MANPAVASSWLHSCVVNSLEKTTQAASLGLQFQRDRTHPGKEGAVGGAGGWLGTLYFIYSHKAECKQEVEAA